MATGYTKGDPSKLDRAGGTMTGPLVLSGAPTAPLHAATKDYVDTRPGGGGGVLPTVRRAYITTGDVTLAANATWTALPGFELAIPAAAGDDVELVPSFMHDSAGADFFDLGVAVDAAIVRRSSTGTASTTTADEGDPALYASPGTFRTSSTLFGFTVQPGDLDAGNVRFVLIARGSGGSKVFASTGYPYRWRALNHGPVN